MGNKIARTTQVSASEYYLHDLPSSYNLVLIEVLGRGRFFKSILCKHDEGLVLVKVYFKRGDPLDLREYEKKLLEIRKIFHTVQHPHVWPFQFWLETDKAAYLLRQYFFSNLHDRLSTRPFLSFIEKKWIAFQLLCAVKQSHDKEVCHGDIKCENVLVTSWNWLYLADFASFKPTYIPDDDPSDFSFFFDTGGRRRCYLAPERFYDHGGETQVLHDAPLKKSMDIFSLGCVIAELFLEGQPLFELSQLLAYRRGQYDPSQYLEKIQDVEIRKMILHMIQLDPVLRLSCESYLQSYATVVFPSYFSPFLHKLFSLLIPLNSDTRVAVTQSAFHEIHKQIVGDPSAENASAQLPASDLTADEPNVGSTRRTTNSVRGPMIDMSEQATKKADREFQLVEDISSLLKEIEQRSHKKGILGTTYTKDPSFHQTNSDSSLGHQSLCDSKGYKEKETPLFKKLLKSDLNYIVSEYNSQSDTYGVPSSGIECSQSCEGMVLIASLICSCMRSVKQPQLRRACVLMLRSASFYIDDDDRLQHVLPYVIAMLSDPAAIVRCAALETLCDVLALVQEFSPSDAKIFPEYILPMLSMLPDDPEESVRICYASNIFKIALTAYRFLLQSRSLVQEDNLDNSQKTSSLSGKSPAKKDNEISNELTQLRKSIAEVVQELVMGPKQTPNIRRALLQNVGHLCYFFAQRLSNDFLLPILPAFLNDRDEQLREVFYGQIVFVCYFIGHRSVEEYLLPYIEQALSDEMEAVIVNALECLSMLCKGGFLRKRILLGMIQRAFSLLCYPVQWVRRATANFIAVSSECLGPVDSYVYLSPLLRPLLLREPCSLSSEISLLSCLKPSVSKSVYYKGLEDAQSSGMLGRQRKIWYNLSDNSKYTEKVEHGRRASVGDTKPIMNQENKDFNPQNGKYTGSAATPKASQQDVGDVANLRIGTSYNAPLSGEARDSLVPDKLQFSGLISPQLSSGNSLFCEPSEGIPLYSTSVDKRAVGSLSSGLDSSLHWNSIGVASSCMSSLDPGNKSLGLSISAPKLVSGSFFNISNSGRLIPRSFQDPEGKEINDQPSIASKFQELTVSDTFKASSSISGDEVSEFDATGLPPFTGAPAVPLGWKPRGVLVAHLQEHRDSVNELAVSNDNTFFVSASDDSTVKIWDTKKLEKDISFRSRLTYNLDGSRALCVTMLRGTEQVAVGGSDGTLHLFSVDYTSRGYSGITDTKKREATEGAILSLLNCSASDGSISQTVLYSTLRCGIHLWDTRTGSATWNFKALPEEGHISSLVMGPCGNWFISGSSRGVLTLWDLRFLLPVNSWRYSTVCPVEKMCLHIPPSNSFSVTTKPLVYVAAGCNEVSLWNAETGTRHQVLRTITGGSDAELSSSSHASARPALKPNSKQDGKNNTNSKYRTQELKEPGPRLPGIRSLLPLPGGDLLTGGTDLKIRYWDHTSPNRSFSVCGPSTKGFVDDEYYDMRTSMGVNVVQEMNRKPVAASLNQKTLLTVAATDTRGCHRDSVLSLASVKLNQRLLISSGRDGAIKVWK